MKDYDEPINIDVQVSLMKNYVAFKQKTRIAKFLKYSGYYRLSRYGKYLLSYTSVIKTKPTQQLLFDIYNLDVELRRLLFNYCKKAEIQFKSHLSNSITLKVNDPVFYLDKAYYTETKGDKDKHKRDSSRNYFNNKFFKNLLKQEKDLRNNINKYPELKDYRIGGIKSRKKIPCWAVFSYFEFGMITNLYSYLRGDLRKAVLIYGYSKKNYGKEVTKQMDTWLDAIRNLRNICAHHNKLVGKTSSVVLVSSEDYILLSNNTDLFSRLYALKKVLRKEDANNLIKELDKVISKTKFDIYLFNILPIDWKDKYERINFL